jgi:hypothetical protein
MPPRLSYPDRKIVDSGSLLSAAAAGELREIVRAVPHSQRVLRHGVRQVAKRHVRRPAHPDHAYALA